MNNQFDTEKVEQIIGYKFKNKNLLEQCFTHSSYQNGNAKDNEKLEFLGDAILDFIVAEKLFFDKVGDEGDMTAIRQKYVSAKPLEDVIKKLKLDKFILCGTASKTLLGKKAVSSLFEALTAGIYIDGGLDEARNFILRTLMTVEESSDRNYKGELQELTQKKLRCKPSYELLQKSGTEHQPFYVVKVTVNGVFALGEGTSVKKAEREAAKNIITKINE